MKGLSLRRTLFLIPLILSTLVISTIAASAEPALSVPKVAPKPKAATAKAPDCIPDQLLVMAAGGADESEFNEAIQAVHGTIVQTIGEGPIKCYVIQTEKGKLAETEARLAKDEHVSMVQRNFKLKMQQSLPVNDPFFPNQWHLPAVNAVNAWRVGNGQRAIIGVLDVGVATTATDLSGKCYAGYDAVRRVTNQTASGDHGSLVASTAGARTNNGVNTAAVAPGAMIYPIKISDSNGVISESAILEGIYHAGNRGIRILNLSANDVPPYSLSSKQYHPAFHAYADWYHNQKNGILIVASGNEGMRDRSPFSPNIMVVSAINKNFVLAGFSNYGNNLWFTGPGQGIYCTTSSGRVAVTSGTSFSAPCVSGVAAMVLGKNPNLTNRQVEQILINTSYKANGQAYTPYYGYGLPNAEAAVRRAL